MAKKKPTEPTLRVSEEKWGKENIRAGWTLIPNALLEYQAALGLNSTDLNILLQIASYWWDPEKHPFPAKKTIANRIGVTARTVQKRIQTLVAGKFIERVERREKGTGSKTNVYKLTPLVSMLKPFSEEIIAEKDRRAREERERPKRRGKPTADAKEAK